jgi:hypothetical protein
VSSDFLNESVVVGIVCICKNLGATPKIVFMENHLYGLELLLV